MKRIPLIDRGQFKARDIIITLLEQPLSNQGISYPEMRKRDRLLDVLEAQTNGVAYVDFEDADYELLRAILESFQFGVGKRDLKRVLDDIANAQAPPANE